MSARAAAIQEALLPPIVALMIAAIVGDVLIVAYGQAPGTVYRMLVEGTWGNGYGIGQVLYKATTLTFTGLAIALGLRANTIAALSLVPLIQVAWADGTIQDNERTAILQGAHGKGLEDGTAGYELLQTWLKSPPGDDLFAAWESYIKALSAQLNDEQNRLLKNQIVGFAKMVAAAAGGILGFGKVSASEEKVLGRIEAAFNR